MSRAVITEITLSLNHAEASAVMHALRTVLEQNCFDNSIVEETRDSLREVLDSLKLEMGA